MSNVQIFPKSSDEKVTITTQTYLKYNKALNWSQWKKKEKSSCYSESS